MASKKLFAQGDTGAGSRADTITIGDLLFDNGVLRLKKENEQYGVRVNDNGELLRLRLLTSSLPLSYPKVANEIAKQWRKIGVDVSVEVPEKREDFEDRVLKRDYDVLLFGQPLLDNLDSYPYWHSSQIQMVGKESDDSVIKLDANNLSQFTDFRTDALLEQIRETHDPDTRRRRLDDLRDVLRKEVPAIVLYSPTYVFAISEKILGVDLGKPSMHSDRFLSMHRWFIKQGRTFKAGKSWLSLFQWILHQN